MIEALQKFLAAFNNRELAISVWLLFIIIWCLLYPKTRKPFFQLIKAFFAWKLVIAYILMFIYIACVILGLKALTIWKIDHIPLTILWCIFIAFVMLFDYRKANDQGFFKNAFKDHIKGLVLLEFFINLYVFNFWIEFMLVPVFAIFGGMKAIAERKKEHENVNKILNSIIVATGSFLILYAVYMIVTDFKNFATLQNLESFYMPILLSILFIPFVYTSALLIEYETFFIRLQFFVPEKSVLRYARLKTVILTKFNLLKLKKWSQHINVNWRFKSRREVDEAVTSFKQSSSLGNAKSEEIV